MAFLLAGLLIGFAAAGRAAETAPVPGSVAPTEVPLVIGNRTLHVFRTSLGEFSPTERARAAERRILQAFAESGEGWTSVKPTDQGVLVQIDGKAMFTIVRGDARQDLGESVDDLANAASRKLQTAWGDAQEISDSAAVLRGAGHVALAAIALGAALFVIGWGFRALRRQITDRWAAKLADLHAGRLGNKLAGFLPLLVARTCTLLTWLASLFVAFVFIAYSLAQFVATRPISEDLAETLNDLIRGILGAAGTAVPGIFVSILIFLLAWIATQISTQLFHHVETNRVRHGVLDAHTAPATRRIVNALFWLFAIAMSYPYLPGSHTEAFKGLTVIMGLMVSIGASGVVGQIASGVILVYTRAVAIGYDTPWRQVHAMLLAAAKRIPPILADPEPYVVQTSLSDFYVAYRLVVYVDSEQPATRAKVASDLHAFIQDEFNRHSVQIMSPHYHRDPAQPKVVPQAQWHASPAVMPAPDDTRR